MAILRMSNIFADSADRLPKEARAKLPKVFKLLIANPRHPSLQVKKLEGATRADVYECRLNQSWRIILHQVEEATFDLVYVGAHDEALRYGMRVAERVPRYREYADLVELLAAFLEGDEAAITFAPFRENDADRFFGFRKITVERPLRLNFQASADRFALLEEEKGFQTLAQSKKKGALGAKEQAEGRELQETVRKLVRALPGTLVRDRDEFERLLDTASKKAAVKLPAPVRKAILSALSERDESAAICRDKDGAPEPDPELRDTESVPLAERIEVFFEREVRPHVPDAWIDTSKRDPKDGQVGLVGYEINFNRYFYRYTPPRPLEVVEGEIRGIEQDILRMLAEVTGGPG